jgi:DNA replicative helicase MCM subunit Mcm2 (Cdc46/Mcm family)
MLILGIDMDKLVSVKGLVIRTTPIIPDMKDGKFPKKYYVGQI